LADKKEKEPEPIDVNDEVTRQRIAEVVHEAICQCTGEDGMGCCAHYAMAGAALISQLTRKQYIAQCGLLLLCCDGDKAVKIDAKLGGLRSGEFHSWIVGPTNSVPEGKQAMPAEMYIIDFTARHYKRYVEELGMVVEAEKDAVVVRASWKIAEPPLYIWAMYKDLPSWLRVSGEQRSTVQMFANMAKFQPARELAIKLWRQHRSEL
jgi:hypothetical protein